MDKEISLSWQTIWKFIGAVLIIVGAWYFSKIILIFMAAWILAASLENLVSFLVKRKLPRVLAATLVYIFVISIVVGVLYVIVPPLFQNITSLIENLPKLVKSPETNQFFKNYLPFINNKDLFNNVFSTDNTLGYLGNIIKNASTIFMGLSDFLLIALIAFYLSIERNWSKNMMEMFLPKRFKTYFINLWEKAQKKMVYWLYSQLVLSMFLISTSIIAFYILNVDYPLFSAIVLGLFDFVPFVGPAIATIVILFINSDGGIPKMSIILLVCLALQYFENIIGPYVRSKFLKVDPIITLLFIAVAARLGGVLGIFVAIPFSTVIVDFLKDLKNQKIVECNNRLL